MSKYCNARFKSTYFDKKIAPKTAVCSSPSSKPTVDQTVAGLLPKTRKARKHLVERSSHMAESKPKTLLFQKICNETNFSSLKSATIVSESAVPTFKARHIPNQTFKGVGTARVTHKTKPLICSVGSIENHPRFKVDVEMMNQKALRNLANLPDLLKKLQNIGSVTAVPVPVNDSAENGQISSQHFPPPQPPPMTPFTPNNNASNQAPKPAVSPDYTPPPANLKDDDDESVYEDSREFEATPEKSKILKTLTRARLQSTILNSLLEELESTTSERVSENVLSALRNEKIEIGRINRRVTLINFINTRLQKLQSFISDNTANTSGRKKADV